MGLCWLDAIILKPLSPSSFTALSSSSAAPSSHMLCWAKPVKRSGCQDTIFERLSFPPPITKLTLERLLASMSATHRSACSSSVWTSVSYSSKAHIFLQSSLYRREFSRIMSVLRSPYRSTMRALQLALLPVLWRGKWEWKSITLRP